MCKTVHEKCTLLISVSRSRHCQASSWFLLHQSNCKTLQTRVSKRKVPISYLCEGTRSRELMKCFYGSQHSTSFDNSRHRLIFSANHLNNSFYNKGNGYSLEYKPFCSIYDEIVSFGFYNSNIELCIGTI